MMGLAGFRFRVHHWGQVEVDAHLGQALGHAVGLGSGGLHVVLLAQDLGRNRGVKAVGFPQPGHPPALLIDGDEQGQIWGRGLERRGQGQELLPTVRIVDQHDAAQMPIPDGLHNRAVVGHPFASKADHDHLPQLDRQGRVGFGCGRGQGDGRIRGTGVGVGVTHALLGPTKRGSRRSRSTTGRWLPRRYAARIVAGKGVGPGCVSWIGTKGE